MRPEAVDSAEFVRLASEALEHGGLNELARQVSLEWSPEQVCSFLRHDDVDARKLGCVALALSADGAVAGCLTATLADPDPQVAELAEQALWAIWFRAGNLLARKHFRRGLDAMAADDLDNAIESFTAAQRADPSFTEAYNQCAIVHYLAERWLDSIEQSEQALERHPRHFGAMAGMGHCHFQLGNFDEASRWYRKALRVHPRMHTVASALSRIERCAAAV